MRDTAPRRLAYIDGLRGLAILLVLMIHAWAAAGKPAPHAWNPLQYGYVGVNLFLLLSGFCLYYPMRSRNTEPRLGEFMKRRARRILPPYWAALTLFAGLGYAAHRLGHGEYMAGVPSAPAQIWDAWVWHFSLLHVLRPDQVWSIDGPMWSLALEFTLYILMPVLVVAARRQRIARACLIAFAVTLAYRCAVFAYIGGRPGVDALSEQEAFVLFYFVPGRWFEFALGMLAADVVAGWGTRPRPSAAIAMLCPLLLCAATVLVWGWGKFNPLSDSLYGVGFALLLLTAAGSSGDTSRRLNLHKVFTFGPLVVLGEWSYSVYLLHHPLMSASAQVTRHLGLRPAVLLAFNMLVVVPIIVALAVLFHRKFERPFMNAPKSTGVAPDRETAPAPGA